MTLFQRSPVVQVGRASSGSAARNSSPENPSFPLSAATLVDWIGGPQAHAGVDVTEHTALGIPTVWRAVNLIAGTAASLPLHAYKPDGAGGSRERVTGGQAVELLADPHRDLTPFELWELVYGSLCLWGNAFMLKLRRPGDPAGVVRELFWLNPGRVRAGRAKDGSKIYVVDGDTDNPFFDDKMLHIPGFGYDGICGAAPVRIAREAFGLALAAEEYGARFFGSGSLASGVLQTEMRLDPEDADAIKARWKARNTGLDSAHDVVVLDSGAKFQPLTIPPEDAQFLQTREFQVGEIARMFGVPPHLLMDVDRSTSWGTGIEQQTLGWVVFGLNPSWLTRVEQRISRIVRPQAAYVKYSLEGLLRGDTASRSAFYTSMFGIGVFSTNEIRELEDRPPVTGGDVRYRPLNMGELGAPDPTTVAPEPAAIEQGAGT